MVLPDGRFGVVCNFYDLSERVALEDSLRAALADKDMLVREIDHRVRNSLSLVSALLTMQGGVATSDEARQSLSLAAARIQAVARIHERLYKSERVGIVDFDVYLEQICDDLRASIAGTGVALAVDAEPLQLSVNQAVPLGLVTNELVTNAFKHCAGANVTITVCLTRTADGITLRIFDDGHGMPADFTAGTGAADGLGMRVVRLLARQVGARLEMPAAGAPADFKLYLPIAA